MSFAVFNLLTCPACGRQTDAPGHCPWCGERLSFTTCLRLRLIALAIAVLCLLLTTPQHLARASTQLTYSAALCVIIFALAASDTRAMLRATLAAVALSALCHTFPGTMARTGQSLRSLAIWAIPLTGLAFIAGGGCRLPPVPANATSERLIQALVTPGFVLALCIVMSIAAARPPTPVSAIVLALGGAIWLTGPCQHPAAFPTFVGLHLWLSFAPHAQESIRPSPHAVVAAGFAAWGLIQSLIEINRSGSVSSSQP